MSAVNQLFVARGQADGPRECRPGKATSCQSCHSLSPRAGGRWLPCRRPDIFNWRQRAVCWVQPHMQVAARCACRGQLASHYRDNPCAKSLIECSRISKYTYPVAFMAPKFSSCWFGIANQATSCSHALSIYVLTTNSTKYLP
jgi:hypothetical protein